jgi:hypothetical protein
MAYVGIRDTATEKCDYSKVAVSPNVALVSVLAVPANSGRRGLTIYNNSANSVYLTYGNTSTSAGCTRILATFTQWDMTGPAIYTGAISAIRNAGTGTLVVTELS